MTAPADLDARIARARELAYAMPLGGSVYGFPLVAIPTLLGAVEAGKEMRNAFDTLNAYKEDSDWGRCEDAQAALDVALDKVWEVLP